MGSRLEFSISCDNVHCVPLTQNYYCATEIEEHSKYSKARMTFCSYVFEMLFLSKWEIICLVF